MGGGLSVHDILHIRTYGHHWKEYSAREISAYFRALSPDFEISRLTKVSFPRPEKDTMSVKGGIYRKLERQFGFLRQNIYAEIQLRDKSHGIIVEPHW